MSGSAMLQSLCELRGNFVGQLAVTFIGVVSGLGRV